MASRSILLLYGVLAVATVGASGCGQSSGTVRVEGRVSYRGEPISNAVIMFYPAIGRPSSAPISESGGYRVDIPPGEYTVIVNIGVALPPGYKEGEPLPPPKIVLPPEYTTQAKSKLTASVSEQGQQPIDFNLE